MTDDIYFSRPPDKNGQEKNNHSSYTEKINSDELKRKPGEMSFGDIITDSGKINSGISKATGQRNNSSGSKSRKKKKKGKLRAILSVFLAFIIFISAALTSALFYVLTDYKAQTLDENIHTDESALLHSSSVYNILLMGVDTPDASTDSRSDAMILLSLDMKSRNIKLTSFLRDSYVNIPGYGNMKLNAACVYGGPQLVCDTIEANFGIRIDDYAKVGFDMFVKIINAVGGVTVPEVDEAEAKALSYTLYQPEPGTNVHMNGDEALLYCRIRKGQDDFYRTDRQKEVISLVLKKLPLSNPVTLIKTAKEVAGTIECSIEKSRLISLLKAVLLIFGDIEQMTVPAPGTWYNDTKNYQAVLVLDFEENKEMLNEFLYN